MNKEILDLSIKIGISYAKALDEVANLISKGLATSIEEACHMLENLF